jgi:hypothetical protein
MGEVLERNFELEAELCGAIQRHRVVRLRYADDEGWRYFRPQAVYWSTADRINATGIQTRNEARPEQDEPEVRNFELAQIAALEETGEEFEYDPSFDAGEERFANGIICVIHPMKLG